MYLFELNKESPLVTQMIAIAGQLKSDVDLGKVKSDWTVDELLEYFRKYNVILDKQDLYNMIKREPMSNYISNIQGDKVTFKGQQKTPAMDSPPPAPEEQQKVVDKMAKKAMKK